MVAVRRRPRRPLTGIELPRADGRTVAARRFRALVETFERDLGGNLTAAEKSLVQQAAAIQLRAEQF